MTEYVLLASKWIKQYRCWADFYVRYPRTGGKHVIIQYGDGYTGPPIENWKPNLGGPACRGLGKCRQFSAQLPDHMRSDSIFDEYIFTTDDDARSRCRIWEDGPRSMQ
jgi:hypothetical protein